MTDFENGWLQQAKNYHEKNPRATRMINPRDHAQQWSAWRSYRQQSNLGIALMSKIEHQHRGNEFSKAEFQVPAEWPTDFDPTFRYNGRGDTITEPPKKPPYRSPFLEEHRRALGVPGG